MAQFLKWSGRVLAAIFFFLTTLGALKPSEFVATLADWATFLRLNRAAIWLMSVPANHAVQLVAVGILGFLSGLFVAKLGTLLTSTAVDAPQRHNVLEPDLPLNEALNYILDRTEWGAELVRTDAQLAEVEITFKDKVVHYGLRVWGRQGSRAIELIDPIFLNDENIDFRNNKIGRTWTVWSDARVCKAQIESIWPPIPNADG
ncbi:hypothetical protein [Rhizorhabdus histidinilytica]|uniref:hypothetical protein n=1 Tax=Rhizorhabdus histidinilytica TaxID=439228 RepID=UPI0011177771|nr:hypothetical protein [Rhizorhabdus histidinilytica]